jgi:hypothetical protein
MSTPILTLDDHFAGEYSFFDRKPLMPYMHFEVPSLPKPFMNDPVKKSRIKWSHTEDEILMK